jgi:hypothetical protein
MESVRDRIAPEGFPSIPPKNGIHFMRVAFCDGEENMPFVKVHLLLSGADQLIFTATDIVVDNHRRLVKCSAL